MTPTHRDRGNEPQDFDGAQAARRVRDLPDEPLDPAFRARLRSEFAGGTIERGEFARASDLGRSGAPAPRLRRFAGLAIAATILLVSTAMLLNRGPAWTVTGCDGVGEIALGDTTIHVERAQQLAIRLRPGTVLRTDGTAQLDIRCAGQVIMQVAPGSEIASPSSAGRWFARSSRCDVRRGELRVVTGDGFHGAHLTIDAPRARIDVVGTTLAVIASPDSTCLCVLDGVASIVAAGGQAAEVRGGERASILAPSSEPRREQILAMERMKLEMLRDAAAPLW
ncbi:MAG: FecR domain-containing protein [bacterium]